MNLHALGHSYYFAALIGFVLTNYTVDEAVGTLQVAVKVQDVVNLPASINLTIQTSSKSASKWSVSSNRYYWPVLLFISWRK